MERRGSICSSAHPRLSTGLECTYLGAVEFLQFTMELLSTACSFLLNDLFTKKDYIIKCQLKKRWKNEVIRHPFWLLQRPICQQQWKQWMQWTVFHAKQNPAQKWNRSKPSHLPKMTILEVSWTVTFLNTIHSKCCRSHSQHHREKKDL